MSEQSVLVWGAQDSPHLRPTVNFYISALQSEFPPGKGQIRAITSIDSDFNFQNFTVSFCNQVCRRLALFVEPRECFTATFSYPAVNMVCRMGFSSPLFPPRSCLVSSLDAFFSFVCFLVWRQGCRRFFSPGTFEAVASPRWN